METPTSGDPLIPCTGFPDGLDAHGGWDRDP